MKERRLPNIQKLFPSEDGNPQSRQMMMRFIEQILTGVDVLKNPDGVNLKGEKNRTGNFYNNLIQNSEIPTASIPLEEVNTELLKLLHDHPYHTKYFLTNILPMASIPGILGMIAAFMVNGNNLWDVYGPAGAEAEVRVISMMSKLIGYDPMKSGGYTTWGGQGAVFSGLRIAIAKFAPEALQKGVPGNLYAFCSDAAHYSLFKSVEATGIGSDKLIRVRTKSDSSMDVGDLKIKMEEVIARGGIPIYIVATTGTTDAMGIDDLEQIYTISNQVAAQFGLPRAHIHADSALGGFFAFFQDYDFFSNPLGFKDEVAEALRAIHSRMRHLHLADSLCFDFQKLGQTPYLTSLFLLKEAADLKLMDLHPDETPYVGHRGYGQYHTGYTLECSRMASSISIYSALLAFGVQGYQQLLAQFVEVNLAFREALRSEIPQAEIVNEDNPGIITLFRIYPDGSHRFQEEISGSCTYKEIERNNKFNEVLFEMLGNQRDRIFFGDTKKHLLVPTKDESYTPLYANKVFIISPYTQVEHVPEIVEHLKSIVTQVYEKYAEASTISRR
ncbi:pyridoxal phosphate-dependent decarboxylase family protein [Paenibacillus aceris]|uniref:Glutamate/tyrosine decarboxylase-like PLP-dependent enzyme n=1 Tax=Paenibacillus aceris TaxID=869555 RepID=A0ABS4HU70_9BACL|nr:pyridoxal-dependent decarboxylase [Paenibacillus aceris]MBP1962173.1 glutamate/tyrosine decarboxylase-like PLP-dependent enzyme [Paenibacillus aceris]NHW33980.1 aspartate aminotransferase family protein [Paenibacillus aceris]